MGASITCSMCAITIFLQNKAGIVLLLPILQVLEEVDEGGLVQDSLLGQRVKIERVGERLYKLELELEASPIGAPSIRGRVGLGHGQIVMAVCCRGLAE